MFLTLLIEEMLTNVLFVRTVKTKTTPILHLSALDNYNSIDIDYKYIDSI